MALPNELLPKLHHRILRTTSEYVGRHFSGLQNVSRCRRSTLGKTLTRRLQQLDVAYNVSRRVTVPFCDQMLAELAQVLSDTPSAKDTACGGPDVDPLELVPVPTGPWVPLPARPACKVGLFLRVVGRKSCVYTGIWVGGDGAGCFEYLSEVAEVDADVFAELLDLELLCHAGGGRRSDVMRSGRLQLLGRSGPFLHAKWRRLFHGDLEGFQGQHLRGR